MSSFDASLFKPSLGTSSRSRLVVRDADFTSQGSVAADSWSPSAQAIVELRNAFWNGSFWDPFALAQPETVERAVEASAELPKRRCC